MKRILELLIKVNTAGVVVWRYAKNEWFMKIITVLLMGVFLSSCSSIDLSPSWRNNDYRCLNESACEKRIKRIVTARFQRNCRISHDSLAVQISMTLNGNGYIDTSNVLNSTDENLTLCALKTLQSLQPYFEITGTDVGKKIADEEIIFRFVSG